MHADRPYEASALTPLHHSARFRLLCAAGSERTVQGCQNVGEVPVQVFAVATERMVKSGTLDVSSHS